MFKQDRFTDRQAAAQAALASRVAKFKERPSPDDPSVLAREAERRKIAEARAAREAVKEAEREAERRRQAEEEARGEAERETARLAAIAAAEAVEAEKKQAKLLHGQLLMEQQHARKTERDARYAARKARVKGFAKGAM